MSFANLQEEEVQREMQFSDDPLMHQAMSSKKVVMMYDVQLQLQASGGSNDTQMCHRFINFETLDYDISESAVQGLISEYLRVLTQAEGATAVLYSKSHSEVNSPSS